MTVFKGFSSKSEIYRVFVILCFSVVFMISGVSSSFAFKVTSTVDRTSVMSGETLHFSISTSDDVDDPEADTSVIKDFDVLSKSSSNMTRIINGDVSRTISIEMELMPKKSGRLEIPAVKVTSGSESAFTSPIEVDVHEDRSSVSDRAAAGESFAESRVSRSVIYTGQPVIYNFTLYFREQISRPNLTLPDFSGFNSSEIKSPSSYTKTVNGVSYNVLEKNVLLSPLKAGVYTIDPALLVYESVTTGSSRDFFGFPQQRLQRKSLRSDAVTVEVKNLPPVPGGSVFSGFVGSRLSVRMAMDKTEIMAGDSATLSIEFEGKGGRTGDIGKPDIAFPASFKVYPDEPESSEDAGPDGFSGKKTFRIAVVPTEAGDFTIAPLKITYFDSDKGIYKTVGTDAANIRVSGGENGLPATVLNTNGKKDEKSKPDVSGTDIFYIKTSLDAVRNEFSFTFLWFAVLLISPAVVFFMAVSVSRLFKGHISESERMKRESLEILKKAASVNDYEEFLSMIYRSLACALSSVTGIKNHSLSLSERLQELEKAGKDKDVAQEFASFFEKIEMQRFGRQDASSSSMKETLAYTEKLVRRII